MTTISARTGFRFSPWLRTGAIFLAVALAAPPVRAAGDPGSFVMTVSSQGLQALAPGVPSAQRLALFQRLLLSAFDVHRIGNFALGRYRWLATPHQRHEYFRLYPEFTAVALGSRLDAFAGSTVRVTGISPIGGATVVNTEVARPDGRRAQFYWYLSADGAGGYRISDVSVDGVSMRIALRNQFASWIAGNGGQFGSLLAVLRQQIAQARY